MIMASLSVYFDDNISKQRTMLLSHLQINYTHVKLRLFLCPVEIVIYSVSFNSI